MGKIISYASQVNLLPVTTQLLWIGIHPLFDPARSPIDWNDFKIYAKILLKINELQRCLLKKSLDSLARKGLIPYLCAPFGKIRGRYRDGGSD
jgi:hypothetical protein